MCPSGPQTQHPQHLLGLLLQPLLLLVSIPFAATGAILLQVVTGVPLGVASMIGVLMLVGIVVTNAIVLIDLVNQYRAQGMAVREALVEGTTRRLRPILMTALATVFALIPLAMGLTGSGGGFISQPLAIVVIGGLLSSTVLTIAISGTPASRAAAATGAGSPRPVATTDAPASKFYEVAAGLDPGDRLVFLIRGQSLEGDETKKTVGLQLGAKGRREVGAADFFQGDLTTAIEPDEFLREVHFLERRVRRREHAEVAPLEAGDDDVDQVDLDDRGRRPTAVRTGVLVDVGDHRGRRENDAGGAVLQHGGHPLIVGAELRHRQRHRDEAGLTTLLAPAARQRQQRKHLARLAGAFHRRSPRRVRAAGAREAPERRTEIRPRRDASRREGEPLDL